MLFNLSSHSILPKYHRINFAETSMNRAIGTSKPISQNRFSKENADKAKDLSRLTHILNPQNMLHRWVKLIMGKDPI